MKNTISVVLCFIFINAFSQEKIPFVDPFEIIEQVDQLGSEEKYSETIELLDKINKNDSLYLVSVLRKSYYYIQADDFENAVKAADFGISIGEDNPLLPKLYNNKAVSLINLDQPEEAVKNINTALEKYPLNYLLHYNKGQALELMGDVENALKSYQQSVFYNPFYAQPHLKMGNLCYNQGLFAQAMMCFNTYLLINPDGAGSNSILSSLNNNVTTKYPDPKYPDISFSKNDNNYKTVNLVLNNHIALNNDYETGNDIDIALTRQNHALLVQLKDLKTTEDFWGKRYLPLYKWIQENGHFDNFTYTVSFSSEAEAHKKIMSKKLDDIKEFVGLFRTKWAEILSENVEMVNGKAEKITYVLNNNSICTSYGQISEDKKQGLWNFFYDEGNIQASGYYNENGDQDKDWKWYYQNGQVKETGTYTDGKLQDENLYYHENGKLRAKIKYNDSEFDGEFKYYLASGALNQKKNFKKGQLDGSYVSYFKVGEALPEFETTYKQDEILDNLKEYYATGELYEITSYTNGKISKAEKYYLNGKTRETINYKDTQQNGPYTLYHNNGQIAQVGQFLDGKNEGVWKSYYRSGNLESDLVYDEGQIDGDYIHYDKDGKLYYKMEYRKGIVLAYEYYDKDSNIIKEDRKKGGEFFFEGHNPNGTLFAKGLYDIKGGKIGEWQYFSDYGEFFKKGSYTDGKETGIHTTYFSNGNERIVEEFKNGLRDGYYVEYHPNKNISQQGWYIEGKLFGLWKNYYIDGTLSSEYYFHKGELHGESLSYSVEGKLETKKIYEYGSLIQEISYDESGNIIFEYDYNSPDKTEVLKIMYSNGNLRSELSYLNKILHGPFKNYYVNGNLRSEGTYLNGEIHGNYKAYYLNGNLKADYNYVEGNLHGGLTEYFEDGSINQTQTYNYGNVDGQDITYHKNGKIANDRFYKNGDLHGQYKFYDEGGNLEMIRFYDFGKIIGYSYLDTNGNEVEMIPIKNGKGKVVTYFNNGNKAKEFEYLDGNFVNEYKSYYYSGELSELINFTEGEYHNDIIDYYKNGQIKRERHYVYGILQGETKTYHKNGKLKSVTNFKNDEKSGISKEYDESGKQTKEEYYFDGVLTSIENLK